VLYSGVSLGKAADDVINKQLKSVGGDGGIIGLDKHGVPVMIFNTEGMYRGFKTEGEKAVVLIYKD
jgi:beta-aspartyl-peptidase (threonine type)